MSTEINLSSKDRSPARVRTWSFVKRIDNVVDSIKQLTCNNGELLDRAIRSSEIEESVNLPHGSIHDKKENTIFLTNLPFFSIYSSGQIFREITTDLLTQKVIPIKTPYPNESEDYQIDQLREQVFNSIELKPDGTWLKLNDQYRLRFYGGDTNIVGVGLSFTPEELEKRSPSK